MGHGHYLHGGSGKDDFGHRVVADMTQSLSKFAKFVDLKTYSLKHKCSKIAFDGPYAGHPRCALAGLQCQQPTHLNTHDFDTEETLH